ncbi:hypothetical protein HYC85_029221 [Camellia sinensis]|uniref:Uncharacterized protein n=1 Tax=Camellia sinensis TaxID=4442 RepID=A0A7J7FXD4_CAMSI|nr:hypothetical protein HYC85_029221 [Camellia sinensis]
MSDVLEEPKMSPLANQQPLSWIRMASKSYIHLAWTKLRFYPLRGSLGRKPGRATQAKVRAREKYKKEKKMQRKEQKRKSKKRNEMKRNEKKRNEKN